MRTTILELPKRFSFTSAETSCRQKIIFPTEGGKIKVSFDTTAKDLNATIDSLMERVVGPAVQCNVCGITATNKYEMIRPVQIHIEGISYPSRSSYSFSVHNSGYHKK